MPSPQVVRFSAPVRQGQVAPTLLPMAQWVDNIVLLAGANFSYTPPSGPNPDFGVNTAVPATIKASFFRVTTNGQLVWVSVLGAVGQPTNNNLAGNGSVCIPPAVSSYFFVLPPNWGTVNFFAPNGAILAIEAWF